MLIQTYFSPVLLFPLAAGSVLGVVCAAALRVCRLAHRPTAIAGALVAACLLVLTQHYASYRTDSARRDADQQKNMSLAQAAFPDLDLNFPRYLASEAAKGHTIAGFVAHGARPGLSWAVDGLLVIAATLVVVWLALRQPYCQACHGWYRTVRTGAVSEAQAEGSQNSAGHYAASRPGRCLGNTFCVIVRAAAARHSSSYHGKVRCRGVAIGGSTSSAAARWSPAWIAVDRKPRTIKAPATLRPLCGCHAHACVSISRRWPKAWPRKRGHGTASSQAR